MPRKKQKTELVDITNLEKCPQCGVSWVDRYLTPEEQQSVYWSPGTKFFSKLIGIYDRDADMTVRWLCPECKTEWDRFTNKVIPRESLLE